MMWVCQSYPFNLVHSIGCSCYYLHCYFKISMSYLSDHLSFISIAYLITSLSLLLNLYNKKWLLNLILTMKSSKVWGDLCRVIIFIHYQFLFAFFLPKIHIYKHQWFLSLLTASYNQNFNIFNSFLPNF